MRRFSLVVFALLAVAGSAATSARAQSGAPVSTDAAPAAAPGAASCSVVVLTLVGTNLAASEGGLSAALTGTLANEAAASSGCAVLTQADINAMLEVEATRQGCSDGADSCLAELGAALGANRVIAGTLARVGTELTINARLMNVTNAVVEQRTEQVAADVDHARIAARNAARALFGRSLLDVTAVGPAAPEAVPAPLPTGPSALLLGGAGVGAAGLLIGVVGGVLVAGAEGALTDPAKINKQADLEQGQLGLVVLGVGAAVAVVGGVLVTVALLPE